jgi:hypothetical protein
MRLILFLLCIAFFLGSASAQPPTKQQIQAQKTEALKEARSTADDLRKQIAGAKAANEDPSSIKELEKQLATVDQMVTVLEKTDFSGNRIPKSLPAPKNTEPTYISPFTPINLKQAVTAPSKDKATDHLLWYTGKKIDANTLITPSGTIVRYERQRQILIVQPDKRGDSNYYGLVNTLGQTRQMKTRFALGIVGFMNSFLMWPEIKKAYDEYDFFKKRYYELAKNTIDLNDANTIDQSAPPDPNLDRNLIVMEQDFDQYVSNLRPVRETEVPLPPKRSDLCNCDAQARERYEEDLDSWIVDFYAEELKILNMLREMYVQIDFDENHGITTPHLPKDEIIKGINAIILRSAQKLTKLSLQYQHPDISVEDGLVLATFSFQKLLIHNYEDVEEPSTVTIKRDAWTVITSVKDLLKQNTNFDYYMKEQLAQKNYNVVLDYSLYLAHEYNKKLISPSYKIEENFFQKWMESVRKFNRFTLSINLNFEYVLGDPNGGRKWVANGSLESQKIVVSLGRSTCKWHLYISDVNQAGLRSNEDSFYLTMKVINGTKTIYRDPEAPLVFSYSGPHNMAMVFPNFEITFCNTGEPDSVLMDKLRYTDAETKAFMAAHPKPDFGKEYSLDRFQYVNKMFVTVMKAKTNTDELVTTAGEMMNMQAMAQLPNSTGDQNLDKLMMEYVMNQKRRSLQQSLTPTSNTANTVVPFNAINGSSVLISTTHSTVDPNDPDRAFGIND